MNYAGNHYVPARGAGCECARGGARGRAGILGHTADLGAVFRPAAVTHLRPLHHLVTTDLTGARWER
jgi:hypothetical protein